MYHSVFSITTILFILISIIFTRPMHLNRRHLDAALKLGVSSPDTITISRLDKIDPLELTLAQPSTTSKFDEVDSLGLTLEQPTLLDSTLASPSTFTTRIIASPEQNKLSSIGIQKTDSFKHRAQEQQPFRITSDGKIWLADQIVQPIKPVPYPLGYSRIFIPDRNLMFEGDPSSFPPHTLQGSSSRNTQIHEVPPQILPIYYGSGSQPVQSFPVHDPSAENFVNLMKYQHHPILDPYPLENQPIEIKVLGINQSGKKEVLPSRGKQKDVIDPDGRKSFSTIRDEMSDLSKFGTSQIWERDEIRQEIATWFEALKDLLVKRIEKDKIVGMKSSDVQRALGRGQKKLTPTFFGFLINKYKPTRDQNLESLIIYSWDYLKSYMVQWKEVDLAVVVNFKYVPVGTGVWNWTPEEVLAYYMWVDIKNTLESKVLSKFVVGWEELNGL
ncbi:uncharacterized protein MELLADRAFT_59714 [Melampsora larici-populina 98AG31]|uniref:Uncharacterized protein n=1 Tax=Melampsora larici-populina (strain 98AG31 / pathotype 3-4-7) TaxID=747676 RepID=F4R712_MELLP|nr:uncharacterized protein MELLADRAFT_59714 [Melampsora larici-populina 98AG31]EGG11497.1 hypothetical protein MELLADRAFT_59714 [Melampsora larici-populina 98AG31]